jgi:hypothetical protein
MIVRFSVHGTHQVNAQHSCAARANALRQAASFLTSIRGAVAWTWIS